MKPVKALFFFIIVLFYIQKSTAQPGSIDQSFNPVDDGFWKKNSLDGLVSAMCIQNDGKILVAGYFSRFNEEKVGGLVRFNPDGTLDANFPKAGYPRNIEEIIVQPDGKILIAGAFSTVNGVARGGIARLEADGTLDTSFNPGSGLPYFQLLSGIHIALQSDGKIIIGGNFDSYNGIAVKGLVRILSDGVMDSTYSTTGVDGSIKSIAIQDDDKLVIGGNFTYYNNENVNHLARINTDGSLDKSFQSGLSWEVTSGVSSVFIQSDKKMLITGSFTSYQGFPRNEIARINADGRLDVSFEVNSGIFSGGYLMKAFVQPDLKVIVFEWNNRKGNLVRLNSDGTEDLSFHKIWGNGSISSGKAQPDGKFVIGGNFTILGNTRRNYIACIDADGEIISPFETEGLGVNGNVFCSAVQKDEKIIIGGAFSSYNGKFYNNIVRLHPDGSLDTTFVVKTEPGDYVEAIAIQTNGKIVMCGSFEVNTNRHREVVRLNQDGTTDTTFNSSIGTEFSVEHISIQTDGKIIIGGSFESYKGVAHKGIARLNTDGSVDTTFKVGTGVDVFVQHTAIQQDGKILIAGYFSDYNGIKINNMARLNTDGTLDDSFHPGTGPNNFIRDIRVQPNGQIIIAGEFTKVNEKTANQIARINSDGTLDTTFSVGAGMDGSLKNIITLGIQKDGKVVVAGIFDSFNGSVSHSIVRLNNNGDLDNTFDVGTGVDPDKMIYTIAIQPDEKIIIGGYFTSYNGTGRNRIARIYGNEINEINETLSTSSLLNVYPNPSGGRFRFKLEMPANVVICDVLGKVKFQQVLAKGMNEIDLSNVTNGLYFVNAIFREGMLSQKIIIEK